jgi:hypothetical protein
MTNADFRSIEDAGRTTQIWSADPFEDASSFSLVGRALVPAALILATATALLLALL